MKSTLLILIALIAINTMAQKDTIYFNKHWQKTTKDKARYYRLIPLEKVGDLYKITDFYLNGNPQMEGFWSDLKNELLEGETKWYFENGKLSEVTTYRDGLKHGLSKTYIENGDLKTEGTYEHKFPVNGTFITPCTDCDVSLYENEKKIATYRYYKNSTIIAQKSTEPDADDNYENFFYDRNGVEFAHVTMTLYQKPINGKMVYYNTDKNRKITIVENYANFKDGILQGEAVNYNNDGKIIAKGIYKDDKPFNGSFTNYIDSTIKNYKNGILNGEELFYSDKNKLVAKGINKNGKRWSGQFYDVYYDNFHTIVNYKDGEMLGKQVSYYTTDFEKIAETSHIKNSKKNGKVIAYNKEGKRLSKGIYKEGKQWTGSFYDFYYHQLSSLKEGVKHGKFIYYTTSGKLIEQQEYKDGKLEGTVLSSGHFKDNKCKCYYKKGEPFKGEVCNDNNITTYKKGVITKLVTYDYNDLAVIESITEYKDTKRYKEIYFVKEKKYELIYKDDRGYEGVRYNSYNNAFYTYKKGLLEGPFSMTLGYSSITVSGNYKNHKHHGIIKFKDSYANKSTTCTYKYGEPINGTILTEKGALSYKDGLKFGQVIEVEDVFLYKNGERELIYNTLEKDYKKGKIEGKVTYFIDDKVVNTNTYKNGKPFNGTFYKDQKFIENYKNGELQTLTCNAHPYTVIEDYTNKVISKVQVTKEDVEPYIGYYKSGKRYNGLFLNFDDKRFPTQYIISAYKEGLKNGLEKKYDINDDFKEDLISTKTYKKDKLIKEVWHNYYVNTSQKVEGSYENEKPHNGYFYAIDNNTFNIFHFKDGIKEGRQYVGYLKELAFVKTDSITYKKGKPFKGNEVTYKYNSKFVQKYENGKAVKTEILNNYGDNVKAIATYSDDGIVTKTTSGKVVNQLVYLDKTKEKARVILYKDLKKVGTLEYNKDKITKLDLAFREAGLDLKYYIDKQGKVTIKARNIKYSIIIHPIFETGKNFYFTDFLDVENLFMNSDTDVSAAFYLDKMKEPISHCIIKKGKPYNGIILQYNEDKKTYGYKKYKEGELVEKVRGLTRKKLIEILKDE